MPFCRQSALEKHPRTSPLRTLTDSAGASIKLSRRCPSEKLPPSGEPPIQPWDIYAPRLIRHCIVRESKDSFHAPDRGLGEHHRGRLAAESTTSRPLFRGGVAGA